MSDGGVAVQTSLDQSTCPICGDKFSSQQYMRSHHKQKHGESIAGFEYTCTYCGKRGWKRQLKARNDHEFCSRECYGNWRSENLSGPEGPYWEGRTVDKTCDNCGSTVTKKLSQIEEYSNVYCDNECQYEHRVKTGKVAGENSPHWRDDLDVECSTCGEQFRTTSSKLEQNTNHFCSTSCYGEWISANLVRENHPRWVGGHLTDYGPNWRKQRQKAFERDGGKCVICKKDRTKSDTEPHVHHIIPLRKFRQQYDDPEWWKKGNDLENLITLCIDHHRKWEGIPLRPVTGGAFEVTEE